MEVKLETIEENKRKLTVTVDAERFNHALDVAFKKIVKDVEIKGFRKGKVPRKIFEMRFGEAALYEEAINYLIPIEYPKALEKVNIEPVAQPKFDIDFESIGKDKDFTFYAIVTVKPEVKLGQYKGLEVTTLATDVTEEDIDREIEKLLNRHAELVIKEDGADGGDIVVIDFVGTIDGKEFEGGSAQNYSLRLGSNSFIPGFEVQLVGIKAGEEREVNVTFPEDYHVEHLRGKEAVFKVTCHEVKTRELPKLDDEFVKDLELEGIETVEQLREDARKRLSEQRENAARNHLIDSVVEQASQNATINIPEEMIYEEAHRMLHDVEHQLEHSGLTLENYMKMTGQTHDELVDQFKPEAEKRIRYNLTLEAIADQEGIKATEDEINQEMEKIAQQYQMPLEQVKALYGDSSFLSQSIRIQKAIDFLVEHAKKVSPSEASVANEEKEE